jgi:enoyl-CoA hydratase
MLGGDVGLKNITRCHRGPKMTEPVLLVEIADGYALMTLNRPKALNALSSELRRKFIHTLAELDQNQEVRAAILTGAGRAFCAGIDLKEIGSSDKSVNANVHDENVVAAMAAFSKPLIGAINGVAVTGGFEISLACDILLAAESAQFADTHVRVGINPGWGLSQHLSRAVGIFRAKELSLTGNFLSARQACDWGLVNHVVPDDQLLIRARGLAADIVANDPTHVVRMKAVINEGFAMTLTQALHMEAERAGALNIGVSAQSVEISRREANERARRSQ